MDLADDGDFMIRARRQNNAVGLEALVFPCFRSSFVGASMIEQHSPQPKTCEFHPGDIRNMDQLALAFEDL